MPRFVHKVLAGQFLLVLVYVYVVRALMMEKVGFEVLFAIIAGVLGISLVWQGECKRHQVEHRRPGSKTLWITKQYGN